VFPFVYASEHAKVSGVLFGLGVAGGVSVASGSSVAVAGAVVGSVVGAGRVAVAGAVVGAVVGPTVGWGWVVGVAAWPQDMSASIMTNTNTVNASTLRTIIRTESFPEMLGFELRAFTACYILTGEDEAW
jgi:hypothetical protein